MPAEPHRDAAAHRLSRPRDRQPRRGAGDRRTSSCRKDSRSRSACSATPPKSIPSWCGAASGPICVTDQTSAHDPVNGYLPQGWTLEQWVAARERDPAGGRARRQGIDGGACPRRCSISSTAGVPTVDYGNNIRQMAMDEGVHERLRLPGLRAGLYPPAVLPRHRAVPLGGAVGRSGGHLQDRREGEGAAARQRAPAPLARHGARDDQVPGPARAHLLGRAGRSPPARPGLQRDGGRAASSRRRS